MGSHEGLSHVGSSPTILYWPPLMIPAIAIYHMCETFEGLSQTLVSVHFRHVEVHAACGVCCSFLSSPPAAEYTLIVNYQFLTAYFPVLA